MFTVFARPLYDPHGFLILLQEFLWTYLPFHIHPDHGIVLALKKQCEGEKLSLIRDFHLIADQNIEETHEKARAIWLRMVVECIRDSIVLLTLVKRGRPIFLRQDVLGFIEAEFEVHLSVSQKIYWFKSTDEGRQAFNTLLTQADSTAIKMLQEITREVIEFWHKIMERVDQAILSGDTKLAFGDENWKERNVSKYNSFFADYLQSIKQDSSS